MIQVSCTKYKLHIEKVQYVTWLSVEWRVFGEFLYLSGFSTEYISRPDFCAVSHTLELFEQNELITDEFVLYQVRTTTLPLCL